ncbi:3-hydroxyacyl-ACP dehydratase FabZ [Alkaliphilus peptidifermentans]|uniref:3-hydroxyacyl-[acyl-carrier-protein] dehydratase n=1 Tax=Alkaliphilus peptidifermentans DSM 18978 TaxID=1120976 RepID=A0A1G5I3B3_9FIRM|nr:3-hydroxyacyl-ACP dehydratase FabZ [Alkaliphilus peptidifermentans]SCY70334.1 3-hydroxyacyl-[acyl-carrier-protein] dehydratase [Alkaliphilus peptidifermentans DSM 18978]
MITFDKIRRYLKQEAPFVFIDKVLEYEVDKRIVALKNVSGGELFSSLHFPEKAIYPGVFLVESVAQTTAVLCYISRKDEESQDTQYLALGGIQQFQFIKPVKPGDSLIIQVDITKRIANMVLVKAVITVDKAVVACGQLSFGVMKDEE